MRKLKVKMFKQTVVVLLLLVTSLFSFTGCANKNEESDELNHKFITVANGKDVVITESEITSTATYYNYEVDGYIIQIFAVKASDGTIRVVFNTCGACNPSPNSYFIQKGEYFECQNCGNKFHIDEIGLTKTFGCSPIVILDEDKVVENGTITISSDFVETYKSKFENINIFKG